jgi:hypothetical protein
MRALCGAIITAGAVIGLGLTALGIGTRYQMERVPTRVVEQQTVIEPYLVHITAMDRPLLYCLIFISGVAIVGLGIAFVGLAYHHHHRHHELLAAGHLPPHRSTSGVTTHRAETGTTAPPL